MENTPVTAVKVRNTWSAPEIKFVLERLAARKRAGLGRKKQGWTAVSKRLIKAGYDARDMSALNSMYNTVNTILWIRQI